MTTRRAFISTLAGGLFAAPLDAGAQQPARVFKIGILGTVDSPAWEALRQGLRHLGYVQGQNTTFETRFTEGKGDRFPELAADLVRRQVDVIVTSGPQAAWAAKDTARTIPVVILAVEDPVKLGLIASFSHPGGNITGLVPQEDELPGKWLQLLKEALPKISRVAVLWDPASSAGELRVSEVAARSLSVRLQALKVGRPDDFVTAFAEAQKGRAEGLIVLGSPFLYAHRTRLVELSAQHRLPTMYHQKEFVVGFGGLMSYGPDFPDLFRRAAVYVDRILRGVKPADLPVVQATKFEFVINMKTAKALGLTIPPSLLGRADQVVE